MKNLKITISTNGIHLKKTDEEARISHNLEEDLSIVIFKYEAELINGLNVNIPELVQEIPEYDFTTEQERFWKRKLEISSNDKVTTQQVVLSLFSDFDYSTHPIIMKRNEIKDTDEYALYYNLDKKI